MNPVTGHEYDELKISRKYWLELYRKQYLNRGAGEKDEEKEKEETKMNTKAFLATSLLQIEYCDDCNEVMLLPGCGMYKYETCTW